MSLSPFINYYKVGRAIFASALIISLQIVAAPSRPDLTFLMAVIYAVVVLLRFLFASNRLYFLDFFFDIFFISSMVYLSFGTYSYLSLLYLFPIFFSSILIKAKKVYLFPVFSLLLYGGVFIITGTIGVKANILNISLHFLAFSLIAFAGNNLREKMEQQDAYIKLLEEEKAKMQGYERLYRVSADLAHELRNPLASISGSVQFLKEGTFDKEIIDMLSEETNKLTSLVNDFLFFSRPNDAPKEEINLSEVLKTLILYFATDKKIDFITKETKTMVTANRAFAEMALNNILKNASEAARLAVRVSLTKKNHDIVIEVEDDGRGVDKEIRDKIFEPFYTTKTRGTGLGLAIAYRVISSFGGTVIVDDSPLGGAKFVIIFPSRPD